jgi:polysaccharide export outer membrane protein
MEMNMRWSLLLFLAIAMSACATSGGPTDARGPADAEPAAAAVSDYKIGIDDMVSVSVWRNPELSVVVPVRPDGRISVPLVGDVDAAGLTPRVVAANIQEALATYVRDPKVAVILTELRSDEYLSRVRVTGAVEKPVSIPHRQGMTVLDAVLAAGGVTEFANANRTVLYRRNGGGSESWPVKLDAILKDGELATNYPVMPGDIVTVPERAF